MIPGVRYGAWQPFPSRAGGHGLLVRFLTCSSCAATLARQFTSDPDFEHDPRHSGTWPGAGRAVTWLSWPWPRGTTLRTEMIPLPRPASGGLPRYGQQLALRHGKKPRPVVRLQEVVELGQYPIIRHVRRRLRPTDFDDILPGDPPVWFNQDARLPCQVYCHNCNRLHLLTGRGPEGAPPTDLPPTDSDDIRPEAVSDS